MEPVSPDVAPPRRHRLRSVTARSTALLAVLALALACGGPVEPDADDEPDHPPGVIWSLDFDDADLGDALVLAPTDDAVTVVEEPSRSGGSSLRLSADQDNHDEGVNPRSQLNGPQLFDEGDEAYIAWSTYLPSDLPEIPSDGWFVFFETHGPPFDGSPLPGTIGLDNDDGELRIGFSRSEQYGFDTPWSIPAIQDTWIDFVLRVRFSKDENVGFVELWVDGRQQTFAGGSTRLNQSTIMESQNEGLFPIFTNYFRADSLDGPAVLFHDEIVVAETLQAARTYAGGGPD